MVKECVMCRILGSGQSLCNHVFYFALGVLFFIFKNHKIVSQCMRMLILRQEAGSGNIVPIGNQGEGHHEFYRKIGSECLRLRITGSSLEFLGKMEFEFMSPRATESKPELLVSIRLCTYRSVSWRTACAAGKMKLLCFHP